MFSCRLLSWLIAPVSEPRDCLIWNLRVFCTSLTCGMAWLLNTCWCTIAWWAIGRLQSDVQTIELETKLSYSEVKSIIRHHCLEKWNQKYIQPTTGSQYKSLFPDVQSKNPKHHNNQIFRLQTGHCRLNYHLHRIAKHQTGLCQVCNVPESVSHFLFHCPHYIHFRSVMKNYVDNMGLKFDLHDILTNKCTFDCVCDFVKSCKKFI